MRALGAKQLAALAVIVGTLPAMWPFVGDGYWISHDGLFHLYRLLSLEAAWQQGYVYPRLFPDFAFGYGFAVLHFYGPLVYYLALALHGLGLGAVAAMKATFALGYPLAALAMWWLVRDLARRDSAPHEAAGVAAALAYTYLPYHLADAQLRGALAESWAFVWWPLILWAAWRVRLRPLALTLAALVLTHNLSVVLLALPLVAWALLRLSREPRAALGTARGPLATLAGAGLAALALSAFYWLPVLLESRHVWIAQDVGGLGFAEHLAPLREWVARGPSYRYFPDQGTLGEHPLSWAQLALLAMAALALPWQWRSPQRPLALLWWATLAASLLLLTPAAFPLWRMLVFPFGLVQYPWRWLGIAALATALLVGLAVATLARGRARLPAYGATALLLGWLMLSSLAHLPWESRPVDVARHPAAMWAEDAAAGQVGATWTAEFLPLTVTEQRWALARTPEAIPNLGERSPLSVTSAGGDGFHFWAEVAAREGGWLLFPRFALPSMRATVDGVVRPVEPRGALGLAAVQVPAGAHRVTLAAMPLARWPWLAPSLAGLALLAALVGLWPWRRVLVPLVVLAVVIVLISKQPQQVVQVGADFGQQARLVSLRQPPGGVGAGETVPLRLLWFNRVQTDRPLTTFIHLTPAGGGVAVAQHDSAPNEGTVPTPRWLPGQLVEDLHLLTLPADLPPGDYELWGGLYAVAEGQALPLPGDSGERRRLGTLRVH